MNDFTDVIMGSVLYLATAMFVGSIVVRMVHYVFTTNAPLV